VRLGNLAELIKETCATVGEDGPPANVPRLRLLVHLILFLAKRGDFYLGVRKLVKPIEEEIRGRNLREVQT